MVTPTQETTLFCYWMLNVSWQRLTPPRENLINTIYAAAQAGTPVSDQDWNNFTQVTAWRYPFFLIWANLGQHWCAEAQLYFNNLSQQPSLSNKIAYNTFFETLVADGNYAELDRLWIFASEYKSNALVSLINPTSNPCTLFGSPVWSQYGGISGNGTSSYVNLNFTPSVDGVNYSLNDCSAGWYNRTAGQIALPMAGVQTTSKCLSYVKYTDGKCYYAINSKTETNFVQADELALQSIRRTASNAIAYFVRGSSVSTNTTASTSLPTASLLVGATMVNNVPAFFTTRQCAACFIGSASIDQAALYASIQTLATSLGWSV